MARRPQVKGPKSEDRSLPTPRPSSGERASPGRSGPLKVWVAMGSDSDLAVMEEATKMLQALGVPYEVDVTSAHRTPDVTAQMARDLQGNGFGAAIVGAGHAAHLAGAVAAHTTLPVIGVPLPSSSLLGLDSLLSTVQMPAGVPVATVAIGKSGAQNAAILAAQILATGDPELRQRLQRHRARMAEKVLEKNRALKNARSTS